MADMPSDSKCPVCDQVVNVPPGGSAPIHRPRGEQGKCPGSGQTTVPR